MLFTIFYSIEKESCGNSTYNGKHYTHPEKFVSALLGDVILLRINYWFVI